jgi:uncharacterized protein
MSAATSVNPGSRPTKTAPWWEIVIVIVLYLIIGYFVPSLSQILSVPLILYMIVEAILRHRTWADFGFTFRNFPSGFVKTFGWFLLVAFGLQAVYIFCDKFFLPEVFTHLLARVPMDIGTLSVGLVISIAVATFLEEVIFRALFQTRLNFFLNSAAAIALTSLVFALGHFSPGPALIVFVDLFTVFIDSLIYGIIFKRSQNVFVAWIAHFLADMFAIVLMILIR